MAMAEMRRPAVMPNLDLDLAVDKTWDIHCKVGVTTGCR